MSTPLPTWNGSLDTTAIGSLSDGVIGSLASVSSMTGAAFVGAGRVGCSMNACFVVEGVEAGLAAVTGFVAEEASDVVTAGVTAVADSFGV